MVIPAFARHCWIWSRSEEDPEPLAAVAEPADVVDDDVPQADKTSITPSPKEARARGRLCIEQLQGSG